MNEKRCMNCMKMLPLATKVCPYCGFSEEYYQVEFYQLPIGHQLQDGRYQVGRVIGEGGFGITYIGWDSKFSQVVAIKEFYSKDIVCRYNTVSFHVKLYKQTDAETYKKELERVKREARTIKQFANCQGIVKVEDFFEENSTVYIVMEYVEGITLRQYMKEKGNGLPGSGCMAMFRPLMESLYQVHKKGIIHRDISMDNIMVQTDGSLKLLDFGSARPADQKTASVTVKYGYAPPEQYSMDPKEQGTWTDVYALCVCLWNCLTGKSLEDAKLRKDTEDIWAEEGNDHKLTRKQKETIRKGLELNYKERIQSVDELYAGLYGNGLEEGRPSDKNGGKTVFPTADTPDGPQTDAGKKGRRAVNRKLLAVAGAILLAAAAAGGIYLFNTPEEEGEEIQTLWQTASEASDSVTDETETGEKETEAAESESQEAAEKEDPNKKSGEEETWMDSNGNQYTGIRINGVIEGEGSCVYSSGSRYEGHWENGIRTGTGSFYWADGRRYEGEWKKDMISGTGTLWYAQDDESKRLRYEGEWVDNRREGTGTCYWANGNRYEGEYKNGSRNGRGIFYWAEEGCRYEGGWADGKMNGEGIMYYDDGTRKAGIWKDGTYQGSGE